jgi:hypothetical protein
MRAALRRLTGWQKKPKIKRVVVLGDGGRLGRTRAFALGTGLGIAVTTIALVISGPTLLNPELAAEIAQRDRLLETTNHRADQALRVADVCLSTAQNLERTLAFYQSFLGRSTEVAAVTPQRRAVTPQQSAVIARPSAVASQPSATTSQPSAVTPPPSEPVLLGIPR